MKAVMGPIAGSVQSRPCLYGRRTDSGHIELADTGLYGLVKAPYLMVRKHYY